VLAVSGTDENDAKAGFATYNYRVDLSAPATNIWTVRGYYADADFSFGVAMAAEITDDGNLP
jgi:hypothetical protein